MEFIAIGFLAGVVICLIMAGTGVLIGDRRNKRQFNDADDVRVYVPNRGRDRSGNKRMDAEEITNTLQFVRMSLSPQEKGCLDYACECVLKCDALDKWMNEQEEK